MKETPREKEIVNAIMKRLQALGPGVCIVRKRHGTSFGVAGDSDLYGIIRTKIVETRHFEIEVKRPGERPTLLQSMRLDDWKRAGAITGVATSVAEALAILGIPE